MTVLIYLLGNNLFNMNNVTRKWIFLKASSVILIPLMIWFILNLVSIFDKDYADIISFFSNQPSKIISFFIT